jgi:hypothetical protein
MDGWMISFTLTPRYTSDMQATTTICILVALITVIVTFLTGELYASPRGLWSAFALGSVVVGPLAHGYKTFEMLPQSPEQHLECRSAQSC